MAELQQQVVEHLQDGAERAGVPVGCGAAGAGQGAGGGDAAGGGGAGGDGGACDRLPLEAGQKLLAVACGAGAGARDRVVALYVLAYDGGGRDEEA